MDKDKVAAALSVVREAMAAILSLVIVGVAIYMLLSSFTSGGATKADQAAIDAYNRQKDILALALGFLGTVTGYYLGRVPAERSADAANARAKSAEQGEAKSKAEGRSLIATIEQEMPVEIGQARDLNDPLKSLQSKIQRYKQTLG